MIKHAIVEGEGKVEVGTSVEPKSQQFAIFKFYVLKPSFVQFRQAYITSNKFTVCKLEVGEIIVGKVAVVESAVFVLASCQWCLCEVVLLESCAVRVGLLRLFSEFQ